MFETLTALTVATAGVFAALHAAGAGLATAFRGRPPLALGAPLGVLLVPLVALLAWALPALWRGGLVIAVVVALGALAAILGFRRGRRREAVAAILAVLVAVTSRFAVSPTALWGIHGASGGNGDLPYYDILARYLVERGMDDPGWILGIDLRTRMLGTWGDGGYMGAAAIAFGALLLGVATASAALPVMFALCATVAVGVATVVRQSVAVPAPVAAVAGVVGGGSAAMLYLVANSFVLMLVAMAVLPLLYWGVLAGRSSRTRRDGVLAIGVAALTTVHLLIGYPTMSLAYILGAIVIAAWTGWRAWLSGRIRLLRPFVPQAETRRERRAARLTALVLVVTVLLCTSRLMQIAANAARTTDPNGGWRLMVARPSALFGEAPEARWTLVDVLLAGCALLAIVVLLRKGRRGARLGLIMLLVVGLALTMVFTLKNGPTAYSAWKPSYFIAPFVIAAAVAGGYAILARLGGRRIAAAALVATAVLLLAGNVVGIRQQRINFDRPDLDELQAALAMYDSDEVVAVALSPWDQLWVAYYWRGDVAPLAPNMDLSTIEVATPVRILSYPDPAAICPPATLASAFPRASTPHYAIWSVPRGAPVGCR